MRNKRKQINSVKKYFLSLFFLIFLIFIIATSNTNKSITTNNLNTVKAVKSSKIENIVDYDYIVINSLDEIANLTTKKLEFTGSLTGYGADCVGCSGKTGCSPYQNVQDGNIYYNDETYGKLRILAADKKIPCGSIIKITNFKFEDDFYGIVLDRGSSVNGLTMDLLYPSESDTIEIGRNYNVNFQIERWGF